MKNTMTTQPMPLEWVVINNRTMKALRCNYNPKTGTFSSQPISYEETTSFAKNRYGQAGQRLYYKTNIDIGEFTYLPNPKENDHGKETAD